MFENNKQIFKTSKMTDVILENYYIILVLERFGMQLGVRDKTVNEVCNDYKISPKVFITIANLNSTDSLKNNIDFNSFEIKSILDYLKKSHDYFLNSVLFEIERNIDLLIKNNDKPEMLMVKDFFNNYKSEVLHHFDYENNTVFPYVHSLLADDDSFREFSINEYHEHHDDIEETLYELKRLLIQHLPAHNDIEIRRKILHDLSDLESDLNIHTIIENEIIIPLVKELENKKAIEK